MRDVNLDGLHSITRGVTVRSILTPLVDLELPETVDPEEIAKVLSSAGIGHVDVAVDLSNDAARWEIVFVNELLDWTNYGQSVSDLARECTRFDMVSTDANFLDAMLAITSWEEGCLVVLEGIHGVGALRPESFLKLPARMGILALLLELEEAVCVRCDPISTPILADLAPERLEAAVAIAQSKSKAIKRSQEQCNALGEDWQEWLERMLQEPGPIRSAVLRCTCFADKLVLLRKLRLVSANSLSQLKGACYKLERLRNDCAHSLSDGADAHRTEWSGWQKDLHSNLESVKLAREFILELLTSTRGGPAGG